MADNLDHLAIRAKPKPVRRFSRKALMLLGGASAAVLLSTVAFALRTPDRAEAAPSAELYNTRTKPIADGVTELPKSYADLPPRLGPPLPGDLGAAYGGRSLTGKAAPENPLRFEPHTVGPAPRAYRQTNAAPDPLAEVRAAPLFFVPPRREAQVTTATAATDRYGLPADLAALMPASFPTPGPGGTADGFGTDTDPNRQDRKRDFASAEADPSIYNPHDMQSPVSPYQVMAGTLIPASLLTGLNSDLPGQVIAQVTEPVYDTVTGRHLLIPQGTRLLGQYDSTVAYGQSRALVAWTRIILPDGSSMVLDGLPAVDGEGYAGLTDEVDRHTGRLVGAAILSTSLSIGSEIGRDTDDDILNAIRDGGQRTINQAGQKVVTRQLGVQPTLTVRPGWRLKVIVNKDLVLQPYGENR